MHKRKIFFFVCLVLNDVSTLICVSLASDGVKHNTTWMKKVKNCNKQNFLIIVNFKVTSSCSTIVDGKDHVQYLTESKTVNVL